MVKKLRTYLNAREILKLSDKALKEHGVAVAAYHKGDDKLLKEWMEKYKVSLDSYK